VRLNGDDEQEARAAIESLIADNFHEE